MLAIVRESLDQDEQVHVPSGFSRKQLTGRRFPLQQQSNQQQRGGMKALFYVSQILRVLTDEEQDWRSDTALVKELGRLQEVLAEKLD